MKLVVLESPYAGDIEHNTKYARACLLDSLRRGEAPIASHLLYTQVLDDTVALQRSVGMRAGWAWRRVADLRVFYLDHGWSPGMKAALKIYKEENLSFEERKIYEDLQNERSAS